MTSVFSPMCTCSESFAPPLKNAISLLHQTLASKYTHREGVQTLSTNARKSYGDIHVFAMTETWLRDNDMAASLEFFPSETYKLFQKNRSSGHNGGGTALVIKKSIDVRKIESRKITSFEYSEFKISTDSLKVRIVIIYRPPYSTVHPVTPATFLEESVLIWNLSF